MVLILGCVLIIISVLTFFLFVIIMGPAPRYRDGLVGLIFNALIECPTFIMGGLISALCCISPTRGRARWRRCSEHALYERNHLLVAFYMLLVWPVELLYLVFALPRLETTIASKCISWILVLVSEYLYSLCVFTDPGTVTCTGGRGSQNSLSLPVIEAARARRNRRGWAEPTTKHHRHGVESAAASSAPQPSAETNSLAVSSSRAEDAVDGGTAPRASDGYDGLEAVQAKNICNINSVITNLSASNKGKPGDVSNTSDCTNTTCGSVNDKIDTTMLQSESEKRTTRQNPPLGRRLEHALNRRYIVDGFLYLRANEESVVPVGLRCTTCERPRPSRSKHCRLCNTCVRRFDHHCPWINNDVAEGTQRYFILFIFCHCISCTWASIDMVRVIYQFLRNARALGWVIHLRSGKVVQLTVGDYIMIIGNMQMLPASLLLFAVMIGIVLLVFGVYQISFAISNVTLNESCKIETIVDTLTEQPSLAKVYSDAVALRTRLEAVAARKPSALRKLQPPPSHSASSDAALGGTGTGTQRDKSNNPSGSGKKAGRESEVSREYAAGTKKNMEYRRKVRKMLIHDLSGLYDRGPWNNLKEVFFPYSVKLKR